ncbi:hypothetical protein BGX24_007822 [Mortierella sp. AD032]|nr:hypothetical protein BGX24_007822 [Mortierella sp. AD032]
MTGITDIPQELFVMIADRLSRNDRNRLASTYRNHYQALVSPTFGTPSQQHSTTRPASLFLDFAPPCLSQLDFPRLQRNTLYVVPSWGGKKFTFQQQLAWFRRCRNLTKQDWKIISSGFPNEFVEALEQRTRPHLEDLSLGDFVDSANIESLFSRLPPLCRFCLNSDRFYPSSIPAFREQLFGMLRVLDTAHCFGFARRMSLSVLEKCVHLDEFKTFIINAEDIDFESRPGVCLNLKHLEALIMAETDESSKNAFDALSRLTHLEHMDFSLDKFSVSDIDNYLPVENNYLQWSLDLGLSRLSTLTQLRAIGFEDTDQEMTEEELEWIFDSWPLLENVKGKFSGDKGYHSGLVDILHERDISHDSGTTRYFPT